jgi:hypothetical protein
MKEGSMANADKPSDGAELGPTSIEELSGAWDYFRAGAIVACALDNAPLALSVDASAGAYRFVCTQCGASSYWFESGPEGVRIHRRSTLPPTGDL